MTTKILISIDVEPGSKECGECKLKQLGSHDEVSCIFGWLTEDYWGLKKSQEKMIDESAKLERLPECLLAERAVDSMIDKDRMRGMVEDAFGFETDEDRAKEEAELSKPVTQDELDEWVRDV